MKNLIITCCLLTFLCFGITTSSHAQQSSSKEAIQESYQGSDKASYLEVRQLISVKGGESTIHLSDAENNSSLKMISVTVNSMKSITETMNYLAEQGYRLVTATAVQFDGNKFSSFYFEKTNR